MSVGFIAGARAAVLLVAAATLAGCATTGASRPASDRDPWEAWNRKVFAFNDALDVNVVKPVAEVWAKVVPSPVRQALDNFYGNINDAWSAVNNLLQGKIEAAFRDGVRVGTNTVLGFGGLLDIASEAGIEHQFEDFGQTLGRWGVPAGPYIVWPLFGPSSLRESVALPLDIYASPSLVINDGQTILALASLRLINTRANLLGATRLLDDIALDKYVFVRDAYLQRRRNLVWDGEPPEEPEEPEEPDEGDDARPRGGSSPAAPAGR